MDFFKKEKDKHLGLRIDSELHNKLHYVNALMVDGKDNHP